MKWVVPGSFIAVAFEVFAAGSPASGGAVCGDAGMNMWFPTGSPAREGNFFSGPSFAKHYVSADRYWDTRYEYGDAARGLAATSGSGSRGKNALWKATIVNAFVKRNKIPSVLDLGCGDGHQLNYAEYEMYTGIDRSVVAIKHLSSRWGSDWTKRFLWYNGSRAFFHRPPTADAALSLEVIFHITEDDLFEEYMHMLFDSAKRFVVIMTYNPSMKEDCSTQGFCFSDQPHIRFWPVTKWVEENKPGWKLASSLQHKYPTTCFSDFFFFQNCNTS
jgi:hypothetical protein